MKLRHALRSSLMGVALFALAGLLACADNSDAAAAGGAAGESSYIIASLLFGADTTTTYVSILNSLGAQTIDYAQAREFSGAADVWVHEGSVFIADAESLTITKFSLADGQLTEGAKLGFSAYGLTSFGFYLNAFVAADKAYLLNGAAGYVVWNPQSMEITGTIEFPSNDEHAPLHLFPGYADRASQVRDGKLYQPLYWTDDTYFQYDVDSVILVVDIATDQISSVITAPCPGLDFVTTDESHNLYFSSWVYAAGAALVLQQPTTCVFEIPAGPAEPSVAFTFPEIAGGRQGAAFRYLRSGWAVFSALDGEHAGLDASSQVSDIAFGSNWRFWSFDLASGAGTVIDGIPWNAGGQYTFDIDQKTLMLVPDGSYTSTVVYDITNASAPVPVFSTKGWSTRLFKL